MIDVAAQALQALEAEALDKLRIFVAGQLARCNPVPVVDAGWVFACWVKDSWQPTESYETRVKEALGLDCVPQVPKARSAPASLISRSPTNS